MIYQKKPVNLSFNLNVRWTFMMSFMTSNECYTDLGLGIVQVVKLPF